MLELWRSSLTNISSVYSKSTPFSSLYCSDHSISVVIILSQFKSKFPKFSRFQDYKMGSKVEKRSLSVNPACNQLERVFRYFDEDGDGKISAPELQSCVRVVGGEISAEEASAVVESSDSDGDGLLGLDDFERLMEGDGEEKKKEEDLRDAFRMYTMDGCDFITGKSLKKMLSRLGESRTIGECKGMISVYDLNGDGVLNFDEFRAMMR